MNGARQVKNNSSLTRFYDLLIIHSESTRCISGSVKGVYPNIPKGIFVKPFFRIRIQID